MARGPCRKSPTRGHAAGRRCRLTRGRRIAAPLAASEAAVSYTGHPTNGGTTMNNFEASYAEMLATLYWDVEALLAEYNDRAVLLSPSACEAMWSKFEALRGRFAALKRQA